MFYFECRFIKGWEIWKKTPFIIVCVQNIFMLLHYLQDTIWSFLFKLKKIKSQQNRWNMGGQACSVRGTNQTDPRQQMQLKYLWREWQSSTTTIFKNLIHYLFDWSRFPNSSKCLNSFSRSLRFLKLILIFCIYFLELFFVGHAVWRTMVNYSNKWL